MKSCTSCQATYPNDYGHCPRDGTPLIEVGAWSEGTVIRGKYRILEKVGQGGMGSVYKAFHVLFGELRALKVINPDLLSDQMFVKRFKQEAVIARKLDHPNAVRVDDIDEAEDGRPFMVMEYIEGESLKSRIQARGSLPVPMVCSISRQVAAALNAAHKLGMVHRDIKPANIVLIQSPQGEQAKVLDFGIARFRDGKSGESSEMTLTGTGVVIGTPQYMSPEQAMGKRSGELDGRSDLYSLGVVMYQMLTGELPFKADTTMELLLAHINTPPRPILEARPELKIPPEVAQAVMRCLEKKPDQRPVDGAALIEELGRAAGITTETLAAPAPAVPPLEAATPAYKTGTSVTAPTASASVTAAWTAATSPTVAATVEATPAAPTSQAAIPPTTTTGSKGLRWAVGLLAAALVLLAGFMVWHFHAHHPHVAQEVKTAPSSPAANQSATASPTSLPSPETASPALHPATHSHSEARNVTTVEPNQGTSTPAKTGLTSRKTQPHRRLAESAPPASVATPVNTPRPESAPPSSTPATGPEGDLILTSTPGALLTLDGKNEGTIGTSGQFVLRHVAAGEHHISLGFPGYPGFQYTVNIEAGATAFVTAKPEGKEGQLPATHSTPSAAPQTASPAHSSPATQIARFPVTHVRVFGSTRGTLVVTPGSIAYRANNRKDSFKSPLHGTNWGVNVDGNFYVRLADGRIYSFRAKSPAAIVSAITRLSAGLGNSAPSLFH